MDEHTDYTVKLLKNNKMNQLIINLSDELNEIQIKVSNALLKLSIIQNERYSWRFVSGNIQKGNLFPSNYHKFRVLTKANIPFNKLGNRLRFKFKAVIAYLTNNNVSSLHDYKMYHPNLLWNNGYTDYYNNRIVII